MIDGKKYNIHPFFYHCNSATTLSNQLKLHVITYLQENEPQKQIQINLDAVLFHQTTNGVHMSSIIRLIMVAKYTLHYTDPGSRYRICTSVNSLHPLRMKPQIHLSM